MTMTKTKRQRQKDNYKKDKDKNTDSEESGEPKQGPGSFARSVSTVSTAHNAYNTFLPRPTYLVPMHMGNWAWLEISDKNVGINQE